MDTFGKRLRSLRLKEGLTQKALAQRFKISESTIGMYERDEREPSLELVNQLANFFSVSTDYLLGRTELDSNAEIKTNENALGERLRRLRENKRLSQKEVAKNLGISNFALSRYENGVANPDPDLIAKFCTFYDVTSDWLLGLVDDPDTYATRESFLNDVKEKGLDLSGLTKEEIEMFQKWIDDYRKTKEKEKEK